MRTETEIELSELRWLSMTCKDCGTVVTIDISADESGKIDNCPHCKRVFPPVSHSILPDLVKVLRKAQLSEHRISFRIQENV